MEEKPRKIEVYDCLDWNFEISGVLQVATEGEEDETCRTFVLHKEDHTLGNSLRYIIMKSPDVNFCGYSIPHPSEEKINFRIQTHGKPANDVLKKGLKDLNIVCEHVLRTFESSVNEHKRRNQSTDIEMMEQSTNG